MEIIEGHDLTIAWPCKGTMLNLPNITGHNNLLEPTMLLVMKIDVGQVNFQPTLSLKYKSEWTTFIVSSKKLT